jgi:hypothetical protein
MGLKGWPQVLLTILGCVGLGVTADLLGGGRLGPGFLLAVDVSHILCAYSKCRDPVKQKALAAASLMHITTHFLEAGAGEVLWCFDTIQDPQKKSIAAGSVLRVTSTLQLAWLGWSQTGEHGRVVVMHVTQCPLTGCPFSTDCAAVLMCPALNLFVLSALAHRPHTCIVCDRDCDSRLSRA